MTMSPEELATAKARLAELESEPAQPAESFDVEAAKQRLAELEAEPKQDLGLKPGFFRGGLDLAGRALDYQRGLVTTPLAEGLAKLGLDTTKKGDAARTMAGLAPGAAERMERVGVPAGPSGVFLMNPTIGAFNALAEYIPGISSFAKKVNAAMPSTRTIGGLALDVATDPLTYETMGLGPLGKGAKSLAEKFPGMAKYLPAALMESGGENLYRSGFKQLDRRAVEQGKQMLPSDVLMHQGIAGSAAGVEKQTQQLIRELAEQRNGILKEASQDAKLNALNEIPEGEIGTQILDESGKPIVGDTRLQGFADMERMYAPYKAKIAEMRSHNSPELNQIADQAEKLMEEHMNLVRGKTEVIKGVEPTEIERLMGNMGTQDVVKQVPAKNISPWDLQKSKEAASSKVNPNRWGPFSGSDLAEQLDKLRAEGIRAEAARTAEEMIPGASNKLNDLNQQMSTLYTGLPELKKAARRQVNVNNFTPVDAAMLALDPKVAGAKKIADLLKRVDVRTGIGKMLRDVAMSQPELINLGTWEALMSQTKDVK